MGGDDTALMSAENAGELLQALDEQRDDGLESLVGFCTCTIAHI